MGDETIRTPHRQISAKRFRTTALVVGIVYLAGMVVGITGDQLINSVLGESNYLSAVSASATLVTIGALLWLLAVVGDAAHGVLMYPVLKPHGERLAIGYLAARIVDAVFIAIMVLLILAQIPLGREFVAADAAGAAQLQALSTVLLEAKAFAYAMAMITLGISGLVLGYTLYKAQLLPRVLAIWAIIGYAVIAVGMVSELLGSGLGLAASIPGGLWEIFIGFWLIIKGFSAAAAFPPAPKQTKKGAPVALPFVDPAHAPR